VTTLSKRLAAETLGSLLLAGVVIGSGVLASRLSEGNDAVALLGNTGATAAILFVLVTAFGPVSGAHFNPAVTLVMVLNGTTKPTEGLLYVVAQICGCVLGAFLAHAMFELPLMQEGTQARNGLGQALSEGAATFTLVLAILLVSRARPTAVAAAVALTIAAGYWWTASTSFANPAITIARAMSDTFAGIRPADVPVFVGAQVIGALLAWTSCVFLLAKAPKP
jgi:glycerol uptake facilitator-like aquaporin